MCVAYPYVLIIRFEAMAPVIDTTHGDGYTIELFLAQDTELKAAP
jgi:hypothetical protein